MAMKKGKSNASLKELCDIIWTIEADLTAGQHLYICGDPDVLGDWDPEMAILMSPTEDTNLWKAEVKMACGVNFKYNYFIKEETWPSRDIIWRPGPVFSISVPPPPQKDKRIMVRDTWMRFDTKKHLAQVWDSWIEETYLPTTSLMSAPTQVV